MPRKQSCPREQSGNGGHPRPNADLECLDGYLTPPMRLELSSRHFNDDGCDEFTADNWFSGNKIILTTTQKKQLLFSDCKGQESAARKGNMVLSRIILR